MNAPLILVLPDISTDDAETRLYLRKNYTTALIQHGAAPFIVPYAHTLIPQYMDMAQGVCIIGGEFSIDPELFNQELQCPLPLKPERTQLEWAYCQEALHRKMPILGICGGMQLLNVVLGGSLIQDLSQVLDVLPHSIPGVAQAHSVRVFQGTQLAHAISDEMIMVNSSHQQSVDRLGHGVQMNALAPDGVVEGIEYADHPFCVGVQWHPEYEHQDQRLVKAFVAACAAYPPPKAVIRRP